MFKLLPANIGDYDAIEVTEYSYAAGIAIALRSSTDPDRLLPLSAYVAPFPEYETFAVDSLTPQANLDDLIRYGCITPSLYGTVRSASGMTTYDVYEANTDLISRWNDCHTLT
ncbi:hypothetical protein [Lacticaseibacillus jixiensis]|uniref:hypothetical protein n=1 Tax=Lacticaseibacillus jixiensis TaxID=3231926 RepID=UPI0036F23F46